MLLLCFGKKKKKNVVYMNQIEPNTYTVTVGSYTFIDSR